MFFGSAFVALQRLAVLAKRVPIPAAEALAAGFPTLLSTTALRHVGKGLFELLFGKFGEVVVVEALTFALARFAMSLRFALAFSPFVRWLTQESSDPSNGFAHEGSPALLGVTVQPVQELGSIVFGAGWHVAVIVFLFANRAAGVSVCAGVVRLIVGRGVVLLPGGLG